MKTRCVQIDCIIEIELKGHHLKKRWLRKQLNLFRTRPMRS